MAMCPLVAALAVAAGASDSGLPMRFSDPVPVVPARPFTRRDAEAIAGRRFGERYGACGMVRLKERVGNVWVFETRIGYGGIPGGDIAVVEPAQALPDFPADEKVAPVAGGGLVQAAASAGSDAAKECILAGGSRMPVGPSYRGRSSRATRLLD
jgi:hypothetical protein